MAKKTKKKLNKKYFLSTQINVNTSALTSNNVELNLKRKLKHEARVKNFMVSNDNF